MIFKRVINKIKNKLDLYSLYSFYPESLQIAFTELALCIENQKLVLKEENNAWVSQISRLTKKIEKQLDEEDL